MVSPVRVSSTVSQLTALFGYANTTIIKAAARAMNLLRTVQYTHPPSCPCHGNTGHHHRHPPTSLLSHAKKSLQRNYATPVDLSRQKEYAFEIAASSIRFGPGVTKEVGMDFKNMGAKKVCVVTDTTVRGLDAMRRVEEGLTGEGIEYTIYDGSRVEPKDSSCVFSPSP
jgi:hydroxyacid-oxoacid transhydrogenase